jgi:hypothetical protein
MEGKTASRYRSLGRALKKELVQSTIKPLCAEKPHREK